LGQYATRWQIGNEPNILGEGNGWAENQITPAGYAQIYNTVRQIIKAQRPQDEVLFAPVSPGPAIPGVRWKDGNEWLAEAIDATLALPGGAIDGFAIHAYGNPFVGAQQAITEFQNDYSSQLAIIDSRSLRNVPVYMTEWNRSTSTTGDLAANEQISADFLRGSLTNVDTWNRTPGNHNIVSLAWFVYQDIPGWDQYSIEWWKTRGHPVGHASDLSTAMAQSSNLLAGMAGTRPNADYNADAVVTEADYNAWRAAFGRRNYPFADGARNGRVDAADYVVWRKTTTIVGAGSGTSNAPEPVAGGLALQLLAIFFVVKSRTSRR
jgi:hypothetical protein